MMENFYIVDGAIVERDTQTNDGLDSDLIISGNNEIKVHCNHKVKNEDAKQFDDKECSNTNVVKSTEVVDLDSSSELSVDNSELKIIIDDSEKEDEMVTDGSSDDVIEIVEVKNALNKNPEIQDIDSLKDNKLVNVTTVEDVSLPSFKVKENQIESNIEIVKNMLNEKKKIDAIKEDRMHIERDDVTTVLRASFEVKNNSLVSRFETRKRVLLNDSNKIYDKKAKGMIIDDDDDGIIEIVELKNTLNENTKLQNIENLKDDKLISVTTVEDVSLPSSKVKENHIEIGPGIETVKNSMLNDNKEIDNKKEESIHINDDDSLIDIVQVKNPNIQDIDSLKDSHLPSATTVCDTLTPSLKESENRVEADIETIKKETLNDNKEIDDKKEIGMIIDDDDDGIIEIVEVQNTLKESPKIQDVDSLKNKLPSVTTVLETLAPSLKEKENRVESGIETIKKEVLNDNKEIDDKKEEEIVIDDDDDGIIEIVVVKNTLNENPRIQDIDNLKDNKLVSVNIVQDVSLPSYKEKENQIVSGIEPIKNKILNDKDIDIKNEERMITDDDDDGIIEIVEVQNTLKENPKIQNIDSLKGNKLPSVTTVLDTSLPSLKEKGNRVESGIEIDDKTEEGIIIDDDDDGIIEIVEVKNTLNENPRIQDIDNMKDNKLVSVNIVQDVSLTSYKEKENQIETGINPIKNKILNDSKEIDDEKEEGMITDDDDDDGIIEIVEVKKTLNENPKIQNTGSLKDNQLASVTTVLNASLPSFKEKENRIESGIETVQNRILNDSKEIDDEKEEGMITDDDDDGIIEITEVKTAENLQNNKFLSNIKTSCDSLTSTYKLKETQSQNTKFNRKLEFSKDLFGLRSKFETIKNRLLIDNKEVKDEKEEGMISDDDDMEVDMVSIEKPSVDNINISKADDKLQITTNKFKESPPKCGIKRKYSEDEKSDIGLTIKRTKNESFTDYKTAIGDNLSITFNRVQEARQINVSNINKTSLKDIRKPTTTIVNDGEMPSTSKGVACSTSGFFNTSIYINDDEGPGTSRRSECSSPDYSGIDKLFFIDTTPGLDPNDCVPSFKAISKNKKVEDKNNCPQSRNSLCFNCGSTEHPLSKCTEPKNKKNISRAKRQFKSNNERYHKKTCRYEHIKPGQMDDEVAKALGLRKGQMPSYRYEMRKHGYPPAWLKAAEVESSGLSIIIQSDDPKKAFDSKPKYRRSDIIDFPGFNSIPFKGFYDDYKFHNVPPLTPNLMKDAFLKTLEPYLVDDEFGIIDDFGNDSIENNKNLSTDSIDMELENDDEECNNVEFCGPLLPNKNKDNDVSSDIAENLDKEFDISIEENVTQDENSPSTPKTNANTSAKLDSYVSTPLINFSGYEKLPPISNFQKDVSCELLLFENLPGTTGSYTKIKNLLDKFRQN